MFEKILIANRGEIARRIMRTCRKMEIRTVAVYSEADRDMPYAKEADEAYYIGESAPAHSYLNIAKIIETARAAGADAIHPGYGFLAENHLFARACAEAGIVFIGPNPEVIEAMGNKLKALEIAKKAGVPTLKRSRRSIERKPKESAEDYDKRVRKIAKNIGYPLLVKPQSGGGGIGMRVVYSEEDLLPALEICRSQARGAFGNASIYLEQYLEDVSHIEVQILGDSHGKAVHLFERDCSMQRRNQKIVEESPARKLDSKKRQLICKYAVKIVKRVKKELKTPYTGAGTVEFLVDQNGDVYFIEMNTRLQVEHGVTEMVTGKDLVELQILIAGGRELPFRQKDIKRSGHAIEVRIYPEIWDVRREEFVLQFGTLTAVTLPGDTDGDIRIDSALDAGESYGIPMDYEPLIMKVVCGGSSREDARLRLLRVLREEILFSGVYTNVVFLEKIIASQGFCDNKHNTRFLKSKEMMGELAIESEKIRIEKLTRNLWTYSGSLTSTL